METIGFGGGCHWCTEAVFQSLKGVEKVEQGWIASVEQPFLSEAVLVHFNPAGIDLHSLISIHLHTHSSTANHSRRWLYRSAVYVFDEQQRARAAESLQSLQSFFDKPLVTKVELFSWFKPSPAQQQNYYFQNPSRPFCELHIRPKLQLLEQQFPNELNRERVQI